jgi:endonuclease/exonuclease/phosphatase family metal-dependent hydrolase
MKTIPTEKVLTFFTWNIGYAGLGREMDFFYEGGKMVRPAEAQSRKYFNGIMEVIGETDSIDFFLFQEVDLDSKRSYFHDQSLPLSSFANLITHTKAINYQSDYIPIPFMNPLGKVRSGLVTNSDYSAFESVRIATPGSYAWPKKLFMLKRCLLITKFRVKDNHDLVVINIHNSAFDDADNLRDKELKLIRSLVTEEFHIGNYVVIGGDWNQNPPGLESNTPNFLKVKMLRPIPLDLMPEGWVWAFDKSMPTNRDVDKPFDKATTVCSTVDFFLTSPNVEVIETHVLDLEFENSDHLPVIMKVRLKK